MEITKLPVKKKVATRRRVAAYARVSTDGEVQLHSLNNQVAYYSNLIRANPEWEFAGIYTDEGITGTSIKKREDFLRMMDDARQGKIDLILTKSVSRFARNTVDLLQCVRELQELKVEVRFEKDGISTFDGEGELMLSLLASFAQAESESISENVKWGKRKQIQKGIIHHYSRCFGYEWKGDDYVIVPEEAAVVRYIFDSYISGMSPAKIAQNIDLPTTAGCPFSRLAVKSILKNSNYTGDRVLQKFYSDKPHKRRRNYGELPQYILSDAHEPIISRETFEKAQEVMKERAEKSPKKTFSCFTGKVKCGHCGRACVRRTIHGIKIWKCQGNEISRTCDARYIREDELRSITFSVFEDEEDFSRSAARVEIYDDHVELITEKDKTITKARKPGRRRQTNAGQYNSNCHTAEEKA